MSGDCPWLVFRVTFASWGFICTTPSQWTEIHPVISIKVTPQQLNPTPVLFLPFVEFRRGR
jgi:hypothetical protein